MTPVHPQPMRRPCEQSGSADRWALPRLIAILVGLGVLLWRLYLAVGLPTRLPTVREIGIGLRARTLDEALIAGGAVLPYLLVCIALVWGWLVVSAALQLGITALEIATQGAAWVRLARRAFIDPFTATVARRAAVGILHTMLLARLTIAAPGAGAAPAPTPIVLHLAESEDMGATSPQPLAGSSAVTVNCEAPISGELRYTVQSGDSLWLIAERYYGTGYEWPRLMAANEGRLMPGGVRFSNVLQPGWEVIVPTVNYATTVGADGAISYVIQPGDTLRGIAANLLGDERCWPTIFAANVGVVGENGRTLTDPDLIWPGMVLTIPQAATESEEPPPAPAPPPTAAPPSPALPPTPAPPAATPLPIPLNTRGALTGAAIVGALSVPMPIVEQPALPSSPPPSPSASPTASPSPQATAPRAAGGDTSPLLWGALGIGAVGAAGAAYLLRRSAAHEVVRRLRRGNRSQIEGVEEQTEPFAHAELTTSFAHRLDGDEVDLPVLTADAVARFLADARLGQVAIRFVAQDRDRASVTLAAPPEERERLIALAAQLGERVGGQGEARRGTADDEIVIVLRGITRSGLLPVEEPAAGFATPFLIPLGVLPRQARRRESPPPVPLFAAWRSLGHVLVAGTLADGVTITLTSLLAELGVRRPPTALRLAGIAVSGQLPDALLDWPHWAQGRASVVDPADKAGLGELLDALRAELARRAAQSDEHWPQIILVVGDLGRLADDDAALDALDILAREGVDRGLRLLVGTTAPALLDDSFLARFMTRLVLRLTDEDDSTLLLGQAMATDLPMTGQFLLGQPRRPPRRLIGYRTTEGELAHLARLMRATLRSPHPEARAGEREGENADLPVDGQDRENPDETPPSGDRGDGQQREKLTSTPLPTSPLVASAESSEMIAEPTTAAEGVGSKPVARCTKVGSAVEIEEDTADTGVPTALPTPREAIAANGIAHPDDPSGDGLALEDIDPHGAAEPASETPLEVFVFVRGEPQVRYRGRPVALTTQGKNHLEFLALLCAAPGGTVHRDVLEQALWPHLQESGDIYEGRKPNRASAICTRLREAVRRAAPEFPADTASRIVRLDRANVVHLNTNLVRVDALRFQRACDRMRDKTDYVAALAAWREARDLFREDLLVNAGYLWVDDAERGFRVDLQEWYRALWADALLALAGRAERVERDPPNAVALYEDAFAAECRRDGPVREDATRGLLRCHVAENNLVAAERAYRALRQEHRRKYGGSEALDNSLFDGDPATEKLYAGMRERASAPAD